MAPQIYPVTLLDSNQVIQYVYDEGTQSLRTTSVATIVVGDVTVDIDGIYSGSNTDPDNIGLIGHNRAVSPGDSDQVNRLTSITNSTVHALDVALHNSDGTAIDIFNPIEVNTNSNAALPTIYNVSAPIAGTEYSQVIPAGVKRLTAKLRSSGVAANLQFSFTAGTSGTNYIKVPFGAFYQEDGLDTNSVITFYFQTDQAGQTLEMITWS